MFDAEREIFFALCLADIGRLEAEEVWQTSQSVMSFLRDMDRVHDWRVDIRGRNICVKYTEMYLLTWREAEWPLESLTSENATVMDVMLS